MIFAVALGVALFVSSYVSIGGIEESIHRSSRAVAGNAKWMVTGSGAGGVPKSLLERIRQIPGAVAAPFMKASVMIPGKDAVKLEIWGVDTQTDSMLRLFGNQQEIGVDTMARMALMPQSVVISEAFAASRNLRQGSTIHVATRSGPADLSVAGAVHESPAMKLLGEDVAFMDLHQAEALFGQQGRLDTIQVAGVPADELKAVAKGYQVRDVDTLSPEARDALLRVQSLYGLSLVAMLIGCFVVFSSVQVTVLERMKELATFRAIGAPRSQLLAAILLEWLIVGLIGSVAGVLLGVALSSVILHAVIGAVNSMFPIVANAQPAMSQSSFVIGVAVGLFTVLAAAAVPALAAIRESPLLALRPHTYRLKHRQAAAFWIGVPVLALGLGLSFSGTYVRTLIAIVLSFLGLALLMPQAVLTAAALARTITSRLFGFSGFLATDNLRKAPQRTAFNVIALGGALAIMVATAAVVDGLTTATHKWIRASLPFDISVTASGLSNSVYSEETIPRSLLSKAAQLPGVSWVYGVRKSFAPFRGDEIMVVGIQTRDYLEAHRRKGSLWWAHLIADPDNQREFLAGRGIFASENFIALTGLHVGDAIDLPTPSGTKRFRILGEIEDYSWPRGLLVTDLDVMCRLWKSSKLTYVDIQLSDPSQLAAMQSKVTKMTSDDYAAEVINRSQILGIADDVVRQSTSAADAQVWLASIIGFLGIANSLIIGVLQRQREIGLLRAVGMSAGQLRRTVAIEALLIGIGAGLIGIVGGLLGGWLPLRHFTFVVTGYLYPIVVPWAEMAKVFVCAIVIAVLAAIVPIRRVAQVPVLTSITVE
ncbi:MAG TPA: FtsX-like permease family protein [Fimbriimonas sp.]|nr:FtsX-like permease family protein [Fimbriimonas sp.]